ncbi:MAG TPA: Xaa-Pro peptidase family protein [Gaiellaceae bacterium]|nr:Xaa-Pro peptidase family protein [Gaiellaceae bacterium]
MPDVLIFGETVTSPSMRHEVPVSIGDDFVYVERNGTRLVAVASLETPRLRGNGLDVRAFEDFGYDDLLTQGLNREQAVVEIALRACRETGVTSAAVPPDFPVSVADHLRANGVELSPNSELFIQRRRAKNAAEIAGIRRAQRGTEEAMGAARDLLGRAEIRGDALVLEGEPLTSERIKAVIARVFTDNDLIADEFIVSHGTQTAVGHDGGSGAILANEPVVLDLFPRDRESGCFSDMTRTFVVGEPSAELREWHRLTEEAINRAFALVRPGANGREIHVDTCRFYEEHGYRTQLSKAPGTVLLEGFYHGLGHGVGLEVHEPPSLGMAGHRDMLVPGDVVTLEPGLYKPGVGGCRLEDIVLVTADGAENLTDFPYDLSVR